MIVLFEKDFIVKKYLKSIAALTVLGTSLSAQAAVDLSGMQLSVYGGGTYTRFDAGKLYLLGEVDTLVPHVQTDNDTTWGLGIAKHFGMQDKDLGATMLQGLSLGVDFFYINTNVNGRTWQFGQPEFNNFTYNLSLQSARYMLDSSLTFSPLWSKLYPFIEGGVGVAQNTLRYHDKADGGNFAGQGLGTNPQTRYAFAYALGAGVRAPVANHLDVSVRYLYTNLGTGVSSQAGTLILQSPLQVKLSTQAWMLGLTYTA